MTADGLRPAARLRHAARARPAARALVLGLVLGLSTGCASSGGTSPGPLGGADPEVPADEPLVPGESSTSGIVTHVVDGDTVDVDGVGRIRVIGIDTPERGACGYESATQAMSVLVLGRPVTLVPGATDDMDRYGRLLRYVDVGARDAGLSLIADGWAIARYDSRDGYGRHLREDAYVSADADSADLGCYPDDEP